MSDDRFKDKKNTERKGFREYVRHVVDDLGTDSEEFRHLEAVFEKQILRDFYSRAKTKQEGKHDDSSGKKKQSA